MCLCCVGIVEIVAFRSFPVYNDTESRVQLQVPQVVVDPRGS